MANAAVEVPGGTGVGAKMGRGGEGWNRAPFPYFRFRVTVSPVWAQQAMSYEDYQLLWEATGIVEGQEGEVGVEAEGSPGRVVAGGRGGTGVEVKKQGAPKAPIYTCNRSSNTAATDSTANNN